MNALLALLVLSSLVACNASFNREHLARIQKLTPALRDANTDRVWTSKRRLLVLYMWACVFFF